MRRLRPSLLWTALFSAVLLVTSSQTAAAASFTLGTLVGANLGCTPDVTCPDIAGDQDGTFQIPGTGFVSVTDLTDGVDDPNFVYSAAADAEFGELHAQASGTYDLSASGYRGATAFALATDQLTISAPGMTGFGTLEVSFLLDGTLEHTGSGAALVAAFITAGSDPDAFSPTNQGFEFDYLSVPSGPVTVPVTFVWGEPFYLSMIMGVTAGTPVSCFACNGGDSNLTPAIGTGSGTADFFNTMTLTGLVPTSAAGPISNAQFSSASGTEYSVNGVAPVPEPASLVLLGTGLTVAFRRRRRG